MKRQPPYPLLLFLAVVAMSTLRLPAIAQGTSLLVAGDHPLMAIGLYATDADGGNVRQLLVSGSFSPELLTATGAALLARVDDRHITRGASLDFAAGVRQYSTGASEIRWKFTLLDFDGKVLRSADWDDLIEGSRPVVREARGSVRAGITSVDYDRTTQADLDARWLEIRLGYGLDLPLWHSGGFIIEGMAAAGSASFRPGAAGYPDLDAAGEQLIFGAEAGGDVRAEFRQRITPWVMAALSFTARERSIFDFDGNSLHRFLGGGELHLLVLLKKNDSSRDEVVQLYVHGEHERAYLGDDSQNLVLLRAGIHYLFDGQW